MADEVEPRDVSARPGGIWIVALAVGVAMSGGLVAGLLGWLQATTIGSPATVVERTAMPPPPPRLQPSPQADLARLRAAESARLNGAGWNDPGHETAHIPIARAQHLMVERGWPGARR